MAKRLMEISTCGGCKFCSTRPTTNFPGYCRRAERIITRYPGIPDFCPLPKEEYRWCRCLECRWWLAYLYPDDADCGMGICQAVRGGHESYFNDTCEEFKLHPEPEMEYRTVIRNSITGAVDRVYACKETETCGRCRWWSHKRPGKGLCGLSSTHGEQRAVDHTACDEFSSRECDECAFWKSKQPKYPHFCTNPDSERFEQFRPSFVAVCGKFKEKERTCGECEFWTAYKIKGTKHGLCANTAVMYVLTYFSDTCEEFKERDDG